MQSTNTSTLDPSKIVAISADGDDDIQFVRCVKINHGILQATPQRNDTHSQGRAARPHLIGRGTSCVRSSSVDPLPSNSDCALEYTRSRSAPQQGRIIMAPPLSAMKATDQVTESKSRQPKQSPQQQQQPTSSMSKRKSIDNSTVPAAKRQTTKNLSSFNARQAQPSSQSRPTKKLFSIPPFDPARLANKSTLPPVPFTELPPSQRRPSRAAMGPPTKPASASRRRTPAALTPASKPTTLSALSPTTSKRPGHRLQPYPALQNHLSSFSTNVPTSPQVSPFSPGIPTPPTPSLTPQPLTPRVMSTQPSTTNTPTASATRRTPATPWSSSQICLFIQSIENAFDFCAFATEHGKTMWEVMDLWSAVVALPLMAHVDRGVDRARMQVYKEKKKTYDRAVRETTKFLKEEARLEREAAKAHKEEARREREAAKGEKGGKGTEGK